jgi:hypothetical protein
MIFDDLLFAIIVAGLALSGAYLRAELLLHRKLMALQRIRELLQREIHTKRVSLAQNAGPRQPRTIPSPIQARAPPTVRVSARALRIFVQKRAIHRIWIRT